jgi:hypothetical protein
MSTAGSLIVDSVDQIIPELDTVTAYAEQYGIKYSFIGAGVCFFSVTTVIMVYAIGMPCGFKTLLYWNVVLSLVLYAVLLTLCSAAMVPIVSPVPPAVGADIRSTPSTLSYMRPSICCISSSRHFLCSFLPLAVPAEPTCGSLSSFHFNIPS